MKLDSHRAWMRFFAGASLLCVLSANALVAQNNGKTVREPVFRVANAQVDQTSVGQAAAATYVAPVAQEQDRATPARPEILPIGFNEAIDPAAENGDNNHPLDPAIHIARRGLDTIRRNIQDYQGYMVKRERINGRLTEKETMFFKIRNRHRAEDGTNKPFSIYMRFVAPEAVKGREVIWVEGRNQNKLVAHDVGWKALFRANLDPDGRMAMAGNRYPIYEAGIENLVVKLIEKAERDRAAGDCKVEFFQGAEISGRKCTVIQVTHPEKRQPYDFHLAQVYIDDELQVPIRYAAYSWPKREGGSPVLEEEYTYLDLEINVGLEEDAFDPDNPEYDYP